MLLDVHHHLLCLLCGLAGIRCHLCRLLIYSLRKILGRCINFPAFFLNSVEAHFFRRITRNTYLAISLAKLGLVTALKLSPGVRTGLVTNREYRLKGPYVVLSFLLLLLCVLCGVIVNSVLKSRFSIIWAPGVRKRQKQRTNLAGRSSPENYYSSGRNTELKLCRL